MAKPRSAVPAPSDETVYERHSAEELVALIHKSVFHDQRDPAYGAALELARRCPPTEDCTNCDGLGHNTAWPHTTCPVCHGRGVLS